MSAPPRNQAAKFGRSDRSALGRWFWEIDRVLLLLVAVLISIGLIAVAAASPAAAQRYSGGDIHFAPLHYFYRQMMWIVVALPVMIGISMLPKDLARRMCILGAILFTVLLVFVPIFGVEVNGARRWIGMGFAQFQPSEFLKPMFIVTLAWILSLRDKDPGLPIVPLTGLLTAIIALLLMKQPNFGETIIFATAWVMLLTLSGVSIRILGILGAGAVGGVIAAYLFYPVATSRIDAFLFATGDTDTYQTDSSLRTLTSGWDDESPSARTPYRLHLLGDRRGIRADRLPRHRAHLPVHRRAGADPPAS
jgi:cell division protein FtsW